MDRNAYRLQLRTAIRACLSVLYKCTWLTCMWEIYQMMACNIWVRTFHVFVSVTLSDSPSGSILPVCWSDLLSSVVLPLVCAPVIYLSIRLCGWRNRTLCFAELVLWVETKHTPAPDYSRVTLISFFYGIWYVCLSPLFTQYSFIVLYVSPALSAEKLSNLMSLF